MLLKVDLKIVNIVPLCKKKCVGKAKIKTGPLTRKQNSCFEKTYAYFNRGKKTVCLKQQFTSYNLHPKQLTSST